jgi:hypothetical protein
MLVGHLGAGLAAKAAAPNVSLGTLFAAAMLLDVVLWSLVLIGVEAATQPADYETRHYLYFNFPYSHSLLAALLWSLAAAVAWASIGNRGQLSGRVFSRGGVVVALTVFSHWTLDYLVHPPQLPIAPGGPTLGMGLWDVQPLGLEVELAIAAVGLALYLVRAGISWSRRGIIAGLVVVAATFTAWGALWASPPPAMPVLASVSLFTIAVLVAIAAWADRPPDPAAGLE